MIDIMLSRTVPAPDSEWHAQWEQLVAAGGNGFMHPAALHAAAAGGADIVTLAAHDSGELVGFWALRLRRPQPFLPPELEALPYDYAFLSTPIIRPDHGEEVMEAFLAAIAADRDLPDTLWLKDFDCDGPAFAALAGQPQLAIRTLSRPIATRDAGIKASGSTRKKLRQDWNRLAALGAVDLTVHRGGPGLTAALETFLRLEAASWKGERGTALLNNDEDAAFTRRFITGMAAEQGAAIALLTLDGRPIAVQVLILCGPSAFTWKIAYDGDFAKFSPGALIVDRLAQTLLAGDVTVIDSCALDSGFMGRLFTGRKETADLVVSATRTPGLDFRLATLYRSQYEHLRRLRNRVRARIRPDRKPPQQRASA
jgi:CelD/BcsL family acetyltransferase involved in cellulose biosynthesis